MKNRIKLTTRIVEQATCPADKPSVDLWDAEQPGLLLRVFRTGHKVFLAFYRVGSGRTAKQRWPRIGDATAISLKDARDATKRILGDVAKGSDPAGERKAAARRERARLKPAIDGYEKSLEARRVVKRGEVVSLLRRELLGSLGNDDLEEIDRAVLVERFRAIEKSGRPGAAKELKTRANVFLGWCVDEGLIKANPLAGLRRQRRTRAERLEPAGRALADAELPIFWRAAAAEGWPFGPYLQLLLLLGQRRTETAMMRWRDLDLEAGIWQIDAEITKSARAHRVPLPKQAVAILAGLPRTTSEYVFPGRHGRAMAGWSKRLPSVYRRTAKAGMKPWAPHDLRRTMRTGLGALGVEPVISELLLNHAVSDDLAKLYDRGEYWKQRADAAQQWADHVLGAVQRGVDNVVRLERAG